MANCPKCKTEVTIPIKSWPVAFIRQRAGAPQVCIGIFKCPRCKSKFRARVKPTTQPPESANLEELVERLKGIREGFVQNLATLRAKIGTLDGERSSLAIKLDELTKAAELRADALEDEVQQLREEIKSLKEFLGSSSTEAT